MTVVVALFFCVYLFQVSFGVIRDFCLINYIPNAYPPTNFGIAFHEINDIIGDFLAEEQLASLFVVMQGIDKLLTFEFQVLVNITIADLIKINFAFSVI